MKPIKRDIRLHGLSSEHHNALVLARALARQVDAGTVDESVALALAAEFEREIEPHFLVEDEVLLPALREAGEAELVERTEQDHVLLRRIAAEAAKGHTAELGLFAETLTEHVRFEERILFPRCEEVLSAEVLDEVARRSPKPQPGCRVK